MAVPAAALHLRQAVPRQVEEATPAWRRNLATLLFVEFVAVFGFNFATPFLSIYLQRDLGLRGPHDLALWTGLCGGAVGVAMAVASPVWGVIADRRGRKVMLLRAIAGGAVSVGLMAVARTPGQLFALCVVQGASSGTVAAATALVAAETPRRHVAHALSLLTGAVALGGALAPVAGGFVVGLVGLRALFAASGVLLLLALLPAVLLVRESPRSEPPLGAAALPHRGALEGLARGTLVALAVLVGAQALMQFSASAAGTLAVLRVLRIDPVHAGTIAGLAFGVAGATTTAASLGYEPVVRRWGYRRPAGVAALLAAVTVAGAAVAGSTWLLVVAVGAGGLFFGVLNPALYAMIGLEAPQPSHGTVYGISGSALALGAGAGPVVTGSLAAVADVRGGLLLAAAVAVLLAGFLWTAAREPGGRPELRLVTAAGGEDRAVHTGGMLAVPEAPPVHTGASEAETLG